MKKDYLEDLKDELEESSIVRNEVYEILRKYDDLYDEYMNDGMAPSEVEAELGLPNEIVSDIEQSRKGHKQGLTPRVYFTFLFSFILYLLIGYLTNVWHPSWLVLLLSPIVYAWTKIR